VRLVLDTNVVFSGLLWRGSAYRLLSAIRQAPEAKLFCSAALLAELADVLGRPPSLEQLAAIGKTPSEVLEDYASIVEFVEPAEISPASPDPEDDAVLACALAAAAELIVSGDAHLPGHLELRGMTSALHAAAA
jgi:putative PIN family toxin of toxin-antitoxin system